MSRPAPHRLIERPRLYEQLEHAVPVVVLHSPSGFGKSVLLRAWTRRLRGIDDGAVALVRPAASDGTDAWWWAVASSLEDSGLLGRDHSYNQPPQLMVERTVLHTTRPLTLVVDNLDTLDPPHIQSLFELLDQADSLRLVLAVRNIGLVKDPRRIGSAALGSHIVTGRDLSFTDAEINEVALGYGVDPEQLDVAAIRAATGGWPAIASVMLAELAASGSATKAAARADRVVTKMLMDVNGGDAVSDHLSPLVILSLAEELTSDLATELLRHPRADLYLASLTEQGLLHNDATNDPSVYRWADAVSTGLQRQLMRHEEGDTARAIHLRLAQWYAARGQAALALRHATQAREWPLAVEVVERHARTLMFTEPFDLLRRSVIQIPLEVAAESTTVLALRDTWVRSPDKLLFSAARLPISADRLAQLGAEEDARHVVEAGLWVISALRMRGWFDEARDYATRLLHVLTAARATRPSDVAEIYPTLQLHAAIAFLLGGHFTEALSCLREAYLWASDNPHQYIESDAASKTALAYAALGDHPRAAMWLKRHEHAPLGAPWLHPFVRSTAATARLLIAVDELDRAAADAAYKELLTADAHRELFWGYIAYAQANYALLTGAVTDMLDSLRRTRAQHSGELSHGAIAGPLLVAAEADLLLAAGRGNQAAIVLTAEHSDHPLVQVSRARLALLSGDNDAALRIATDSNRDNLALPRSRLEMLVIQAVAAHRHRDRAEASRTLQLAVAAARMTGSLRAFRTVPVAEIAEFVDDVPEVREVLAEAAVNAHVELFPARVTLVTLTPREQQLLEQLAGDLTRQQIANSFRVSFNTIKVQLRGLYRKLDVESRADAIARGREYGLLR
jgi:LuxR family maltose regulon positive regulatory protein